VDARLLTEKWKYRRWTMQLQTAAYGDDAAHEQRI
jgi:hypothetical protein